GPAGFPSGIPQIQGDRLPRWQPPESFEWHVAIRRAEVFTEAEVRVVSVHGRDGGCIAPRRLYLKREGIGLDVNAARAGPMLLANLLSARHIQKRVGVAVEPENLLGTHAVAAAVGIVAAERPVPREAVRFQDRRHALNVARRVRRQVVDSRIVNPAAGVFDVIRVVTQAAQGEQVVQKLVGHACQRIPEENPENEDLAFVGLGRHVRSPKPRGESSSPRGASRRRMTCAGLPATTAEGGTSSATTERAPTTAPSPIVTPGSTQASKPIHTLRRMRTGRAGTSASKARGRRSGTRSSSIRRFATSSGTR